MSHLPPRAERPGQPYVEPPPRERPAISFAPLARAAVVIALAWFAYDYWKTQQEREFIRELATPAYSTYH